jgi:hypothetical protein
MRSVAHTMRLCAHADDDGPGVHWLQPGQTCDRERAHDLSGSPSLRALRACLDLVDGEARP